MCPLYARSRHVSSTKKRPHRSGVRLAVWEVRQSLKDGANNCSCQWRCESVHRCTGPDPDLCRNAGKARSKARSCVHFCTGRGQMGVGERRIIPASPDPRVQLGSVKPRSSVPMRFCSGSTGLTSMTRCWAFSMTSRSFAMICSLVMESTFS